MNSEGTFLSFLFKKGKALVPSLIIFKKEMEVQFMSSTPKGKVLENKCFEVAYNFVNLTGGNKKQALMRYLLDHPDEEMPKFLNQAAYKFFDNNPMVWTYIEKFREENRKANDKIRDENIAMLKQIAADPFASNRDRIAAMKELSQICGLNEPTKLELRQEVIEIGFDDEDSFK